MLQVVEMTEAGKTFLREKFRDFDFNRDSLIDSREEVEMFETAPHRQANLPQSSSFLVFLTVLLPVFLIAWPVYLRLEGKFQYYWLDIAVQAKFILKRVTAKKITHMSFHLKGKACISPKSLKVH